MPTTTTDHGYISLMDKLIGYSDVLSNLAEGEWRESRKYIEVINPLNGEKLLECPDTQADEFEPFLAGFHSCPKSGLHNPLKNVERYLMLGEVSFRAAALFENAKVADYFARLIQSVMPKSYAQCMGEVRVVKQFLKNFSGDQVRFLACGHSVSGDHAGQQSHDYRWPYGPVVIITPFNFPLEIPVLQLLGALYTGNRPLVKSDSKVSLVIEQFIRLLHMCGLPMADVDLIHCDGPVMGELLRQGKDIIRLVQFTGSNEIANEISQVTRGKVRVEDSGFDWKILGPDFDRKDLDYVAWQCDQDAYAASGQKCSAQSILFMHENWDKNGEFVRRLAWLARKRNLADLTIGPVLTWTTEEMLEHVERLGSIEGSRVLFGGNPLTGHSIPDCYGAFQPTAVFVPIEQMARPEYFEMVTTEVFGPVQVVTEYNNDQIPLMLDLLERMENHLTAAVVSRDQEFINKVLGSTVNGTTYTGIRARTTGAPQNHWFGPSGDPRGAGIGTPEAILHTWSAERCIISDVGPINYSAELVQS